MFALSHPGRDTPAGCVTHPSLTREMQLQQPEQRITKRIKSDPVKSLIAYKSTPEFSSLICL